MMTLIPAALVISAMAVVPVDGCPMFGSNDSGHNLRCLVSEYQAYADQWSSDSVEVLVLAPDEAREVCMSLGVHGGDACVTKWSSGRCLIVLPAPFGFDDLWGAEGKCERGG